jgi:hypothetical protein
MKKLGIALGAAMVLGSAAPAMAADYYYDGRPPATCMDHVNAHYGAYDPHHRVVAAPFWAAHALLCHVFHRDEGYVAVRG